MIRLEANKMQKAIERAKAIHPRVKYAGERTYTVTGSRGNTYTVRFAVVSGMRLGECDCPAGQAGMMCFHIASACLVNIMVQSMRKQVAQPASHALAGVLVKVPGRSLKIDGWDL